MIKSMKSFFRNNPYTKRFYTFLWYWRHKGFNNAKNFWKHGEETTSVSSPKKAPKTYHYQIIHSAWRMFGADKDILDRLNFYAKSSWCWEYENPRLWLVYICCLLETKQDENAKKILTRYISLYGLKDIENFLPVSSFAVSLGFHSEKIDMAATVFYALENNRKKHILEEIIKNKTIAVVGNAGCELGLHKGQEIDAHDIVIRFNNYPSEFAEDYGCKTDIWARCGNVSVEDRENIDSYKLILWEPDYWHMNIQHNHLEILHRDILHSPDRIAYINPDYRNGIFEDSGLLRPTTGCYVLWLLHKIRGSFENIDIYGFSFPYEDVDCSAHYYDNLAKAMDHNMDMEQAFLKRLYSSASKMLEI